MEKKQGNIYMITNLINGKTYIGQDSKNRIAYTGSGKIIKQAIKKYGIKSFKKDILEECDLALLNEREIFWIQEKNSTNIKIGYNISHGGNGGDTFTNNPNKEEIRKKRSISGGNRRGVILSKETRAKISKGRKGIIWGQHTKETKILLSNMKKGKKFTTEHKHNLSIAQKNRIVTMETRIKMKKSSIGKINIKTYLIKDSKDIQYITTTGLTDFCRQHALTPANMHKTLTGERKHHKGWKILKCLS